MTIAVVPNSISVLPDWSTRISLFEKPENGAVGSVGQSVPARFHARLRRPAAARAWDLAALAMAVMATDRETNRLSISEDGWTRQLAAAIAVSDPSLWNGLKPLVERTLSFLTGDLWKINFVGGGFAPPEPKRRAAVRNETCVSLLSGGLDSLIGAIDVTAEGERPIFVSNRVNGDCKRQKDFAVAVGAGDRLLGLNHNTRTPAASPEISQRPRSIAFIAFGVLAATTLDKYGDGAAVDLHVPENGFISLNVPLSRLRAGSLSTRTTHPIFMKDMQDLLDGLGLRVRLTNRYAFSTKGEMMRNCADKTLLATLAKDSMSCGRAARPAQEGEKPHRHCGRCLPCLVRRAAFFKSGGSLANDGTEYIYPRGGVIPFNTEAAFRQYDDVMQCLEALDTVKTLGQRAWIGSTISANKIPEAAKYKDVAGRGLKEIGEFLTAAGVV
jgi:hypothetical protein